MPPPFPAAPGYSLLQDDPERVAFLVEGWEYYPGQILEPEDFLGGVSPQLYTYIGQYPNFSKALARPTARPPTGWCCGWARSLWTWRSTCRSCSARGGYSSAASWSASRAGWTPTNPW